MLPCSRPFSGRPGVRAVRPAAVLVRASKADTRTSAPLELSILVAAATVATAGPAHAGVDEAVGVTINGIQAIGNSVKSGFGLLQQGADKAGEVYNRFSPKLNELAGQARPYVERVEDVFERDVLPAAKDATSKAVPAITDGARSLLKSTGVDADAVARSADSATQKLGEAADRATPFVYKIFRFFASSSPEALAKYAAIGVVTYFTAPFALKLLASGFRGYAGEVTPASAVDLVTKDGSAFVIDIRSAREKDAVGVPQAPGNAKGRFLELELVEIERRLRGQLRNVDAVEAQVTALQIRALKRVKKGNKLILLDKSGGGPAKAVARELSRLGFRSVFIVGGGFSGWTASRLQIKQARVFSLLQGLGRAWAR